MIKVGVNNHTELLVSERSERDTISSVEMEIGDIFIYIYGA